MGAEDRPSQVQTEGVPAEDTGKEEPAREAENAVAQE